MILLGLLIHFLSGNLRVIIVGNVLAFLPMVFTQEIRFFHRVTISWNVDIRSRRGAVHATCRIL